MTTQFGHITLACHNLRGLRFANVGPKVASRHIDQRGRKDMTAKVADLPDVHVIIGIGVTQVAIEWKRNLAQATSIVP